MRDEHLLPNVSRRLVVRRRRSLGLDRLKAGLVLLVVFVAAACGGGGHPKHLLNGAPAAEFTLVDEGVLTAGRTLPAATFGARLSGCLNRRDRAAVAADSVVVERVGVEGESLSFATRDGAGVYACDGGVDPAGERPLPWCGTVFGERVDRRLLDPRLDVNCRDREGSPLAYAFVEPVAGARWIGVAQEGYVEVYEVLAGLPVRVATARGVRAEEARATFEITQYDGAGHELVRAALEAAVAG